MALITRSEVPQTTRHKESTTAILLYSGRRGRDAFHVYVLQRSTAAGTRMTLRRRCPQCPAFGAGQHTLLPSGAPHRRGLPLWCTRVAVLGLNRHVFSFGRLPLRDGHLQDAVPELGGGVLRLDGRRECDGPCERPRVEFSLVVIRVFPRLVLLHVAFERQGGIGHVDLEVLLADPRYLCLHDNCLWRLGDFNRRCRLAQRRRFSAEDMLKQPIHFAAQRGQSAKRFPPCLCHSLSPL